MEGEASHRWLDMFSKYLTWLLRESLRMGNKIERFWSRPFLAGTTTAKGEVGLTLLRETDEAAESKPIINLKIYEMGGLKLHLF